MKKLFLFIILLSVYSFGQENRIVRQNELSDSLDILRTLIGTGGVPLPDSTVFTSELTPYVDKSSTQTITGQKNFSGTVNFPDSNKILMSFTNLNAAPYGKFNLTTHNFNVNTLSSEPDVVMRFGHNITTGGGQEIPNIGAFAWEIESHYDGNGYPAYEAHWAYTMPNGTLVRPISVGMRKDNGVVGVTYYADYLTMSDSDGVFWQQTNKNEEYWQTPHVTVYPNNNTFTGQLNSDSTGFLFHPYIDNQNRYNMGGDINTIATMGQVLYFDSTRLVLDYSYPLVSYDSTGTERNILNYSEGVLRLASANKDKIYLKTESLFYEDTTGHLTNIIDPILPLDTTGLAVGKRYVDANTGNVKYMLGENLITNGDFNEWTAGVPDNWVTNTPDTTNFYYENDTGQLHFIQLTGLGTAIYQGAQSVGVTYGYSFNVTQILDTVYVFEISGNTPITQTGYYTGQSTSIEGNPLISITGTYGHCEITIDNIKVWDLNGAKQPIYEPHQTPITINGVTITDTVFIGRMGSGAVFDSIRVFDVQDSIAIQIFYRNPTDNDLITTVDTLTSDTTIPFDTTTIPAGAKVYMYPVYVGDSEAYLRSEIYWRD